MASGERIGPFDPREVRVTEAPPGATVTYIGVLTEEQRRRVEAMEHARNALRGFGGSAPDAMDLYYITQYIIDGRDPWESLEVAHGERQES